MKSKFAITLLLPILLTLLLTACEDDDDDNDVTKTSNNSGVNSHNAGQVCLTCHKFGGVGEYVFTTAGTVYQQLDLTQPLANVKIVFHSGPDATGTLVHTIEVDALGNFFTTEPIAWNNGLYISVIKNGTTTSMSFPTSNGNCGRCHGQSTLPIYG